MIQQRHKQYTIEQLSGVASEMNEVMGLIPPINVASDLSALYNQITINSKELIPTDKASFNPTTVKFLRLEGLWPGSPEPKPITVSKTAISPKASINSIGDEKTMTTRQGTMTAFVEEKINAGLDNKAIIQAIMAQYNLEQKPATMRLGAIRHNLKKKAVAATPVSA